MRVVYQFRQNESGNISFDRMRARIQMKIWRVNLTRELCEFVNETDCVCIDGFDTTELNDILEYVSTL